MAVPVKPVAPFEAGLANKLFDVRFADFSSNNSRFDVSRDGRFLIPVDFADAARQSLNAIVNWPAALKH